MRKILSDERDIFFVFVWEMFDLCSKEIPIDDKLKITTRIENRMTAFTFTSGIVLHKHTGYNPGQKPAKDSEYY